MRRGIHLSQLSVMRLNWQRVLLVILKGGEICLGWNEAAIQNEKQIQGFLINIALGSETST